jgi:hypothetical protein
LWPQARCGFSPAGVPVKKFNLNLFRTDQSSEVYLFIKLTGTYHTHPLMGSAINTTITVLIGNVLYQNGTGILFSQNIEWLPYCTEPTLLRQQITVAGPYGTNDRYRTVPYKLLLSVHCFNISEHNR